MTVLARSVLTILAGAYPRGSLCALMGLLVVFLFYLYNDPSPPLSPLAPAEGRKLWIRNRDLLIGISLSIFTLVASALADVRTRDVRELGFRIFAAIAGAGAVTTLLMGCLFLWRHWKEIVADLRHPRDLFHQLTGERVESETESLALLRAPLIRHSLWGICILALAIWASKRLGFVPERLLENPVIAEVYEHILWVFIVTLLVTLWSTRNRFVVLLRACLLLVFTLIIVAAMVFFLAWLASETAPALAACGTAMVLLNFVRFVRASRTLPRSKPLAAPTT